MGEGGEGRGGREGRAGGREGRAGVHASNSCVMGIFYVLRWGFIKSSSFLKHTLSPC